MKNTIEIYLKARGDGTNAEVKKDFAMYVGSYQNKLIDVYVPKSLLYSNQENTFNNAVKIGGLLTASNGSQVTTNSFYLNYLKDTTINSVEYSVFGRVLPKELTVYAGNIQIVVNCIAIDNMEFSSTNFVGVFTSFDELNAYITEKSITLTDNSFVYVNLSRYKYNLETTTWVIDTATGSTLEVVTTQIANLLVQNSSYIETTDTITPTQYDELSSRVTTNTSNIYNLTNQVTTLNTDMTTVQGTVTEQGTKIENLESIVGEGEYYVGTMTVSSLPTDGDLRKFVIENTVPSRIESGGDTIIVVLQIEGATDKNYKYIYNGTNWISYEIPPIENAGNGTKGILQGTFGVGKTYNTLVDIVDGEIKNIYIKDNNNAYRNIQEYLNSDDTTITKIVNGSQIVGEALRALQDGLGQNIVDTYLTQNAGASKQYVKDYALPKVFYQTYYISSTGYLETPPTTPASGIQFSNTISSVATTKVFDLSRTLTTGVTINKDNSSKSAIYISTDTAKTIQLRLVTKAKKSTDTDWTTLSIELSNMVTTVAGEIQRVDFDSAFSSLSSVMELSENDMYGQELYVLTTDSNAFTFSVYGNLTYASSFVMNTSTEQIVISSGKLGEIPNYTLTGVKSDTTISYDLASSIQLYNNVQAQFYLYYDGTIADTDTLKITYGGQDIRIVTPYNYLTGNATYKDLNQTNIVVDDYTTITFIGLIQIDSGSNISVVVNEDNLTATKNELNVSAKEEIVLGANGTIENNIANFVVEDSETYLPYRVNGTKFLLDLSLPVTGTLTLSDVVTITFGDTTYYLVSAYDGSTHLTLTDLYSIKKYSSTTGYRYIFDTMFFANSNITGFAIISTIGNVKKVMLTYDGTNITRNGVTQTFADIKSLVEDETNIVEVIANNFNVIMRYDAFEDDAIWFNSRYKINGVNYLNRLIINSSNEIIFDDDAVLAQYATMPTASESLRGDIVQYIGATNTTYTNGYFYKCGDAKVTSDESVVANQLTGYNLGTISVDKDEYIAGVETKAYDYGFSDEDVLTFEFRGYPQTIKVVVAEEEYTATRDKEADEDGAYAWYIRQTSTELYTNTQTPNDETYFYGQSDLDDQTKLMLNYAETLTYNTAENGYWTCDKWYDESDTIENNRVDLADYGISYNGVAIVGAKFTVKYTYARDNEDALAWVQINVQPNNDAQKVIITLTSETQVSGTITEEELALLKQDDENYIETIYDGHIEIYKLDTSASSDGFRTYTHIESENNNKTIKSLTITESVLSWVITELTLNDDLVFAEEDESITDVKVNSFSNPNLLINGDFKINQRGETAYTFSDCAAYKRTYTVDRWRFVNQVANSSSSVTKNTNSISIYCANQYDNLCQYIEDYSKFAGKTVTLSCNVKSITSTGFTISIWADSIYVNSVSLKQGLNSFTATLPTTISSNLYVRIDLSTGSQQTVELEYVKLEIGSVATAFSPRPYAEELALCQRYYQVIYTNSCFYIVRSANEVRTIFRINMRTKPTVVALNKLYVFEIGTTTQSVEQTSASATISSLLSTESNVYLNFTGFTGLTQGNMCLGNNNLKIVSLDAEFY